MKHTKALPLLLTAALGLSLTAARPAPRATPARAAAPAVKKPGPVSDALVEAMRALPEHARPLFAVGDVDEDGAVDGRDRVLIRALAKTPPAQWPTIAGATCAAAADLDLDGAIGTSDVALADELLAEGRIATPALFHQAALPCRFERPILAGQAEARRGEDLPLWILAPGYVKEDVDVTVEEGTAKVKASTEPRTILLAVGGDAKKPDDAIVLRISFRGGRAYLLTVSVVPR